jgi:hypothetical protein
MRHHLQRFYIDCPDWRLKVDVRGLVSVDQDLSGQLEAVARHASTMDDLMRGLIAFARPLGMVAVFAKEPQWDGAGLELEVGLATAA